MLPATEAYIPGNGASMHHRRMTYTFQITAVTAVVLVSLITLVVVVSAHLPSTREYRQLISTAVCIVRYSYVQQRQLVELMEQSQVEYHTWQLSTTIKKEDQRPNG